MDMQRATLARAIKVYAAGRAVGERALVAAVIAHAARDALDGDAGAAAWFLSDGYRFYLELLGLPPEWLPAGVTRPARATSSGRRPCLTMSHNVSLVGGD